MTATITTSIFRVSSQSLKRSINGDPANNTPCADCNTNAGTTARWRPEPPARERQNRADIWAVQVDGPISPELRWLPGEYVSDERTEAWRRWHAISRRYEAPFAQNAQTFAPATAGQTLRNAAPVQAPPRMHPQPVNNDAWPAAPSFVMIGSDYNDAAIGYGPVQSFQQQQLLPHGQGTNMLQGNLAQFGGSDGSAAGMPQGMQPPYSQQQRDPQAFTDGMRQFDEQQAFGTPLPMQQGLGNNFHGDTYPTPDHLGVAHGAASGPQLQHQELQVGGHPGMMHLHHPAFNSVVLRSPAHQQCFEDPSRPTAGPSGTNSRAGRRRSANEAFGTATPNRTERGYVQQRASHSSATAPRTQGILPAGSPAFEDVPGGIMGHTDRGFAQLPQQMGPPEPGSRRAGKQPVCRGHEHDPGCVDGHAAVDSRAQQRRKFASRVPEMPHASQVGSPPVHAVPQQQESSDYPAQAEQPGPTAPQGQEAPPQASGNVGLLAPTLPADLDFNSNDPVEVDRCIAWLEQSLDIRDATPPTSLPAMFTVEDPQAALWASQGGGVAPSSASSGSADGTLTPGSEIAAMQDPQTAPRSPQGSELTPSGAIAEPTLGDLAIDGFDGEPWGLIDGNEL